MNTQEHDRKAAIRRLRLNGISAFACAFLAVLMMALRGPFDGNIELAIYVLARLGMVTVLIIGGIQLLIRSHRRDFTIGRRQRRVLFWTGVAFVVTQLVPLTIVMIGGDSISSARAG